MYLCSQDEAQRNPGPYLKRVPRIPLRFIQATRPPDSLDQLVQIKDRQQDRQYDNQHDGTHY